MSEQRFGIFGKDVTRYIPPELRPFAKFAHEMNPVVGFQRAGQALKEGDYGDAALETGILAAAPVAYFGKTLIKPSVTAGIDALKEMFLLGAADEVAKKAPVKKGVSRRDVLAGMGAAVLAPPVAKGIGDLIPATGAAKVAKVGLKGPIGSAAAKANKLRDLYFGTEKALKGKGNPVDQLEQALKQGEEMDAVTLSMNKELSDIVKGKNYDDFMKLKDEELIALGEIQQDITHVMRTGSTPKDVIYSGAPLRDKNVSEAISKAIDDRGLRGKVTDLSRARMFESLAAKREARKRAGFIGEGAIDLPSSIVPKMFPSEKIIKNMVPTGPKSPSLFPTEAKKGRQLLIVSCGSDKCPDVGNMKALDRYLGPVFSSIRKAGVPPNVDVAILSAKHGLIRSDTPIKKYDQLMTDEVRDKFFNNPEEMGKILNTMQGYDNVVVQGGENYRQVIAKAAGDLPYKEFRGGIGEQRSQVGKYLAEEGRRGYFRAEEGFKKPKDTANLFHFTLSKSNKPIEEFSMDVLEKTRKKSGEDLDMFYTTGDDNVDLLGLHVGSPSEASGRGSNLSQVYRQRLEYAKKKFPEKIETKTIRDGEQTVSKVKGDPYDDFEGLEGGTTYGLEVDVSKPFLKPNSDDGVWSEGELSVFVQNKKNRDKLNKVEVEKGIHSKEYEEVNSQEIAKIRQDLAKEGYTNIPYVYGGGFSPEKVRGDNIKQILLIDRPNKEKIILSQTDGKPMAKGGIAGLSDVARDMFKGPKGIGTYESFMVG